MLKLSKLENVNSLYKLGISQVSLGSFFEAIQTFQNISSVFLEEKDYLRYIASKLSLVLLYIETQEDSSEIHSVIQDLEDFTTKHQSVEGFDIIYQLHISYIKAIYLIHSKKNSQAEELLNQTIENIMVIKQNLENDSSPDSDSKKLLLEINTSYIYYCIAALYNLENRVMDSMKVAKQMQLTNQNVEKLFVKVQSNLSVASDLFKKYKEEWLDRKKSLIIYQHYVNAFILIKEKKYQNAEKLLWLCYEKIQTGYRRKYLYMYILYYLVDNYINMQKYEDAKTFLMLIEKSSNPSLKRFNMLLTKLRDKLEKNIDQNKYDIVIRYKDKVVEERNRGVVNFKNQFMLLDILKLLASNKGVAYSKEDLVQQIWKTTDYNPLVHDNKVYVTIKRLRNLIEPNKNDPKYIFRSRDGYYIKDNLNIVFK